MSQATGRRWGSSDDVGLLAGRSRSPEEVFRRDGADLCASGVG
ncbi:hypothetical protein HMPREF1979_02765 [Actinomyces johnsonii F0542]|uniref:Uncharacterized protein n=1 Tax=Actinomyces johnsonii F0542 TaxID=1321818 RepID=U1QK90_9ACTO|nr:hypothetical protein HMPREF1979_02765 [Actinomyces johnsonii F0542]